MDSVWMTLAKDKEELKKEGILHRDNFLGNIILTNVLTEAVKNADFVFEAAVDDTDVKRSILDRISHMSRHDTIIASNTIRLDINDLAQYAEYPERVIGLRFLYPVYCIPEVELTTTDCTAPYAVEKVKTLLTEIGKTLLPRSGSPLVLSPLQIEARVIAKRNRIEETRRRALTTGETSDVKEKECAICMDKPRNCVFRPCNHMCSCIDCAKIVKKRSDGCPICRKRITEVLRVFQS
ncbi:uncharacterized protein TRIADDRAFT_59820 [Trichoplax adhaerens]|uniref:RING-type domain-containing protein n=1 Tax=Trichoplax adhaerens TaxID=10228 RepID=B3S6I8_TRIAD|nr:hypothetical protein TRIADDRAFT_59820 [Trichoplax adhaerens]EDV21627.1 hypothetical protein TRIADDRAFT_59820 [Trichoplax adhaerens]|eukprot:XP_002115775.1 hypothetical protein TRIADDRAFT_59820 [Trichoplax adhaerens]